MRNEQFSKCIDALIEILSDREEKWNTETYK